jgi:dihydrofolate synthase / folylpolyglutamate synthase
LLAETLDGAAGMEVSFFEATTAAAFLAFARARADACIVEVGLGGRLDATNVVAAPLVCGIAQLGHDHHFFLGDTLEGIAAEKAGIAKPGVPWITQLYPPAIAARVGEVAAAAGAAWLPRGLAWDAEVQTAFAYRDQWGAIEAAPPALSGAHQAMNAALAMAMIRHQRLLDVPEAALRASLKWADWPARLQCLAPGPLRDLLPREAELWLDGAHNPTAARAVADHFRGTERPFHLVLGLLANKHADGVLQPFRGRSLTVHAVPVPDHDHHPSADLAERARAAGMSAMAAASVADALGWIARHADRARPPLVLVMGSLYLAGAVLAANDQVPD